MLLHWILLLFLIQIYLVEWLARWGMDWEGARVAYWCSRLESGAFLKHTWERVSPLEPCKANPKRYSNPPLKLSLQVLLICHAIHMLYGECFLSSLSSDELQLAEEEIKVFKIPFALEIVDKRWSGTDKRWSGANKLKVGDTITIDLAIGDFVPLERSIEDEDD